MGLRKEMQNWFDIVELSKGLRDTGQMIGEQDRAERMRQLAAQAPEILAQQGGAAQFAARMGAEGDTTLLRQLAAQQAGYDAESKQGFSPEQLGGLGVPASQQPQFANTSLEKQKILLDQLAKKEEQAFKRSLFDVKEATKAMKSVEKDIPQAQANAAGFYKMMEPAHTSIDGMVAKNPEIVSRLSTEQFLQAINAPQNIKDQGLKQFATATRAFINSQLRKESGAAIADSEFKNALEQYIPQAGDGADVLAQKRDNRIRAMAGMKTAAGKRAIESVNKQYESLSGENKKKFDDQALKQLSGRIDLIKDAEVKESLYKALKQHGPTESLIQIINKASVGNL